MKISIKETLKNHKGNVEHQSIWLASISNDVDATDVYVKELKA